MEQIYVGISASGIAGGSWGDGRSLRGGLCGLSWYESVGEGECQCD